MKKIGGRTSSNQNDIIDKLRAKGYEAIVCEGADEAYSKLLIYVYGNQPPDWLKRFVAVPGKK